MGESERERNGEGRVGACHCELSEAISLSFSDGDCFVTTVPRNDSIRPPVPFQRNDKDDTPIIPGEQREIRNPSVSSWIPACARIVEVTRSTAPTHTVRYHHVGSIRSRSVC